MTRLLRPSTTPNNPSSEKVLIVMKTSRKLEYTVALGSFLAAVVFAFVSLYISNDHEVAAGNCTIVAQFLLLTASIFGIDYKLNSYGKTTTTRPTQQQSA